MDNITNELQKLSDYTRLAWDRRLTESSGGNMSVRIGDNIYITPTSFIKHFIKSDDFVVIDMNGEKIKGKYEASSESKMHIKIYQERKEIKSIFHAHPRWSSIYAVTHEKIPINVMPRTAKIFKDITYVPYTMAGTQTFANALEHGLRCGSRVFILENHGVTIIGESIEEAYSMLDTLESCSFITIIGRFFGDLKNIHEYELSKLLNPA